MVSSSVSAAAQALIDDLLTRCSFPSAGSSLHCAVSGGPDSSALVVLGRAAGCQVTAHHVDHGLRQDSAHEADLVADLAARFGAAFVAHTVQVAPGSNLEARARDARYGVLPEVIATGHTLDDRAETIMINTLRGAARRGLSPLTNVQRHPIAGLRRAETHELCAVLNLTVVNDPMNDDARFLRTRVRAELLPLMNELADRDVAPILDRQATMMADEDALLDSLAAELDPTDARAIAQAHPVLARRALRQWIELTWAVGLPPDGSAVERAYDVACGRATASDLGGGHRVHRTNQQLRIE